MQIQNSNSTSFGYGYKFIRMPNAAKKELPYIITERGKTVYDGFEGKKTNAFLVAKDCFHDIVAEFIEKYNLTYRFYPEIKSSMDFKTGHPEKVSALIKDMKPETIVYDEKLRNQIAKRKRENKVKIGSSQYVVNIERALGFKRDKSTMVTKHGVKIFNDVTGRNRVYISPPNEENIHFVKVEKLCSTTDGSTERYSITTTGEKLHKYESLDDIMKFSKLFKETFLTD